MSNSLHTEASKLDIKIIDEKGRLPFQEVDFSATCVYEIYDETLRTPLEKADTFEQLLQIPYSCELWIVPVTEETASVKKSIHEEKTSALFSILSSIRNKMQLDRTFLLVQAKECSEVQKQLQSLGYTATEKKEEELLQIQVEF
ncbi:hypothetical protein [Bacillus xiapuensis]|uniref:hypothetical protein n=1 Tax=Bacillus xiapuensis TaxID=2014075 RepID=UPI000C247169|nr:hypothetical protein [Bacillus xiapuensis]